MDYQDSAVCQDHQDPWVHQVKTATKVNLENQVKRASREEKEML